MSRDLDRLLPAELVDGLPDPSELKAVVRDRIQTAYAELFAARGEVSRQEDTYDLHRRLQATRERVREYARGFTEVDKLIGQLQQEELVEAVGEQDGVPLSGMTIPSAGGDITVKPVFARKNDIDPDKIQKALVEAIASAWASSFVNREHLDAVKVDLGEVLTQTLTAVLGTGKWEPQISKLKATAEVWAREGMDALSGDLMAAHTVRKVYQDKVDVSRKASK